MSQIASLRQLVLALDAERRSKSVSPSRLAGIYTAIIDIISNIDKDVADEIIAECNARLEDLQKELSKTDSKASRALTMAGDNKQSIDSAFNRIDTADSKIAELTADIAGSLRKVDFSGVESPANAPAVKAQSVAEPFTVVFLTTADKFVVKKGSEYYTDWAALSDFYDDGNNILTDRLFRDASGCLWYYSPSAGKLVKFSTSEDLAAVKKTADQAANGVTALTGRVEALEAVEIPEVDLTPIEERIDSLEGNYGEKISLLQEYVKRFVESE
ncbi:MAG: hypothetical protein K2J70_06795, partial [Muribaculaceae bacterium]|nr:hypothetical protein [Muribaculaceae bacterium]